MMRRSSAGSFWKRSTISARFAMETPPWRKSGLTPVAFSNQSCSLSPISAYCVKTSILRPFSLHSSTSSKSESALPLSGSRGCLFS